MQVTLFRALKSIKIDDDQASAVIDHLEAHVESVVNNNITRFEGELGNIRGSIAALEGKFTGMEGKFAGLQTKLEAMDSKITFMMAVFGLAIAAGPVIAKLVH